MGKLIISKDKLIVISLFLIVFSIQNYFLADSGIKEGVVFQKYLRGAELFLLNELPAERITDFSPVYLYIHSLAKLVINDPAGFIQIFQLLLMAFTSAMLYLMLRLFYPLYISLTGAIIFSILPEVLIYGKVMEPEPFMIFFLTGFLYFFSRFSIDNNRMRSVILFISALFFAFGLLIRSNFFILLIIIPAFIIYKGKISGKRLKTSIKQVLIFLLPSIVAILFLWIRNYNIGGNFIPYFQNPGYILFEGNNPNSTGQSAIYPPLIDEMVYENLNRPDIHHQIYRDFARAITGKDLSIVEVNNFWSDKAKNFIFDHPERFLKLTLIKLQFFFHDYSRHDVTEAWLYHEYLNNRFYLIFPFWIISAFAIMGLVLNLKEIRKYFPQYIVFFTQLLVLVAGYVSARQRFAVLPLFIFFASGSVFLLIKNRKKILFIIPVLVLCFFFLFLRTNIMYEEDFLWESYRKSHEKWVNALNLRNKHKWDESKKSAAESLTFTPWLIEDRQPAYLDFGYPGFAEYSSGFVRNEDYMNFSEKFNYSILLIEAGKFYKAGNILKSLISDGNKFKRDFDHSSQPDYYLGIIDVKQGNNEEAISRFKKALDKSPGSPFSLSYLFALTGDQEYKYKLFRYFDRISGSFFMGRAFFNTGEPLKASEYFQYVVDKIPNFRKGLIYLSASLSRIKKYKYAFKYYLDAIKMRLDPVILKKDIITVFDKAADEEPWNGKMFYYYGIVLEQFGELNKALNNFSKGDKIMPGNDIIKKRINRLKNILPNK
ncbi:MAG: glycosyltransferase family 39 protein [Acidobacteriota bacterium]